VNIKIPDGFLHNLSLKQWASDYYTMQVAQMEVFRHAQAFRPKWYVVPDGRLATLAPYQTIEAQLRMPVGSWIWGLSLSPIASTVLVRIVDNGTKIPLFEDFIRLLIWPPLGAYWEPMLIEPRAVVHPGEINVEIANEDPTSPIGNLQLVIYTMEPAVALPDQMQERIARDEIPDLPERTRQSLGLDALALAGRR
jgi:hypothetical protein